MTNQLGYSAPLDMDPSGSSDSMDGFNYVDFQYADLVHDDIGEHEPLAPPSGLMTPAQSQTMSGSRRPSLMIDETNNSWMTGPSSASSFESSLGCLTPCSSTPSTTSTSRRQSALCSDNQHWLAPDASPSPAFHPRHSYEAPSFYSFPAQGVTAGDIELNSHITSVPASEITPCCPLGNNDLLSSDDHTQPVEVYRYQQQTYLEAIAGHNHPKLIDSLGSDVAADFHEGIASQSNGMLHIRFQDQQYGILKDQPPCPTVPPLETTFASAAKLQPPFIPTHTTKKRDSLSSDDDFKPAKRRPTRVSIKTEAQIVHSRRPAVCDFPGCKYACNRHEHLKRHKDACHNPEHKSFPCVFEGCIDKKTDDIRRIASRNDNYKAHFTKTHFRYGHTEKSGKNRRWSMKASLDKGIRDMDFRWSQLLANEMSLVQGPKEPPGLWKMLGYSIRETQQIQVKDIAPEWQGPDGTTLKTFDPRWKGLKAGSLTFEQAMAVGTNMEETYKQGVLGVDMLETEEMGLGEGPCQDPRWQRLLSGEMSIEESEKLGIKDRNPAWIIQQARRRR